MSVCLLYSTKAWKIQPYHLSSGTTDEIVSCILEVNVEIAINVDWVDQIASTVTRVTGKSVLLSDSGAAGCRVIASLAGLCRHF